MQNSGKTNLEDSYLIALEDRLAHEIFNSNAPPDTSIPVELRVDEHPDRIMLTISVLHPSMDLISKRGKREPREPFSSPQHVIRYALTFKDRLSVAHLEAPFVLAAYYGYAGAIESLVERSSALVRAMHRHCKTTGDKFDRLLVLTSQVDSGNFAGVAAVHAACLGADRPGDRQHSNEEREGRTVRVNCCLICIYMPAFDRSLE